MKNHELVKILKQFPKNATVSIRIYDETECEFHNREIEVAVDSRSRYTVSHIEIIEFGKDDAPV